MPHLIYFLMAFAGGTGLAIQAAINSKLASGVGGQPVLAAFISFFIGTVFLGLIAWFQSDWHAATHNVWQQPWWHWLGGLIGATFVFIATFLAPKIGLINLAFVLIIGQLVMGMLIDQFGLLGMNARPLMWWKYVGLLIMLLGLVVFMFGDKVLSQLK